MDINMRLLEDKPTVSSDESSSSSKTWLEKWKDRTVWVWWSLKDLFQNYMRWVLSCDSAKDSLMSLGRNLKNLKITNLMNLFSNTWWKSGGVRNYLLTTFQVAIRLREVNNPMMDDFLLTKFLTLCQFSLSSWRYLIPLWGISRALMSWFLFRKGAERVHLTLYHFER